MKKLEWIPTTPPEDGAEGISSAERETEERKTARQKAIKQFIDERMAEIGKSGGVVDERELLDLAMQDPKIAELFSVEKPDEEDESPGIKSAA